MHIFDEHYGQPFVLDGTSTVIGFDVHDVQGLGTIYCASPPIAGKCIITSMWANASANAAASTPHRFSIALATEVPTDLISWREADHLFPAAGCTAGHTHDIHWTGALGTGQIQLRRIIYPAGRRIVARIQNGRNAEASLYVGLVVARVVGGEPYRTADFLSGEKLKT